MPEVRSGSASIYYEVHGSGPALVFAHGAGGNRLSWWQQVPAFAATHRVVTFDHRCFGRSACPPDDFHPRHFAADLLAILEAEGIDRAALVCQSMGGWTGMHTALAHPERVGCLVLAGTPGGVIVPAVLEAAAAIGSRAQEEGIRGNAALAPDYPSKRPDMAHLYEQISALNVGFEPHTLGRMFDEEGRVPLEALSGFTTPTLMLSGECDQLFPPRALHEAASHIPGAKLREFPGIGHSIYFEDAPAFNAAVAGFLAAHP